MSEPTFIARTWASIGHAMNGLVWLIRTQRNFRIHLAATAVVIGAGTVLKIMAWEWCAVLLASGMVMMAEALNTAIELLGDAISRENHPLIGRAKDVAAGGVWVAAMAAAAVGLVVFAPRVWHLVAG